MGCPRCIQYLVSPTEYPHPIITYLQMCVSRQKDVLLLISAFNHDTDQVLQTGLHLLNLAQEPKTHIRRDLIVPGSSCMQLPAELAYKLAQSPFVRSVNILIVGLNRELYNVISTLAVVHTRTNNMTYCSVRPLLPHCL